MEFDNSFEVPLPVAEAWLVLMDIERIVPCVPGAELTEIVDQDNFKGKVSVRLGPVALGAAACGAGCSGPTARCGCSSAGRRAGAAPTY